MRIHINSYIRKGRHVRAHKREVYTITPVDRKVFSKLTNVPYEVGGQLDFNKGKLKNALVNIGNGTSTEWEYDPNYEVSYHTHPNKKGVSIMPSYDDIASMKVGKEKGQVIFIGNYALSIVEKDKFEKAKNKDIKEVSNELQNDYEKGYSDIKLYTKFKPILLDKLGLDIKLHKPDDNIKLEVKQ